MSIDLGGIIASGLAGGGQAVMDNATATIDARNKMALDQQHEEMIAQKQMQILRFQREQANEVRQEQAARIGAERDAIIKDAMARKFAGSDAAVAAAAGGVDPTTAGKADPNPNNADLTQAQIDAIPQAALTPDQLGVINQAKANNQAALKANPDIYLQAGMNTGDLALHDLATTNATITRSQALADASMYRSNSGVERQQIHETGANTRATAHDAKDIKVAQIRGPAGSKLTGADKAAHDDVMMYRTRLIQAHTDLRALQNQQANMVSKKAQDAKQVEIDAKKTEIDTMEKAQMAAKKANPVAAQALEKDDEARDAAVAAAPPPAAEQDAGQAGGSSPVPRVDSSIARFKQLSGGE